MNEDEAARQSDYGEPGVSGKEAMVEERHGLGKSTVKNTPSKGWEELGRQLLLGNCQIAVGYEGCSATKRRRLT